MGKALKLYNKYKQEIRYLFFGVLTTIVNQGVFALGLWWFPAANVSVVTAVAWLISVIFAYLTNRKWVFESKVSVGAEIFREGATFFGARLFSGGADIVIVSALVANTGMNPNLIKLGSNVIVVILNYVMSKLIIFRKRRD